MQEYLRVNSLVLAPDFDQNLELSKEFSKSRDILIKFHYVPSTKVKGALLKVSWRKGWKRSSFFRKWLFGN